MSMRRMTRLVGGTGGVSGNRCQASVVVVLVELVLVVLRATLVVVAATVVVVVFAGTVVGRAVSRSLPQLEIASVAARATARCRREITTVARRTCAGPT